jgi:hypothetical protein
MTLMADSRNRLMRQRFINDTLVVGSDDGRNEATSTLDRQGTGHLGFGDAGSNGADRCGSKDARVPGRQKLDMEVLARRITRAFNAIGERPDACADEASLYDQLIENTDRLRELITATNAALDTIVAR